jgi:phosphoribosylanthranilate isomerase
MLVKICGITRLEDAEAAVRFGAAAIGFVFWPGSPRCAVPARARIIVDALPAAMMKVGVFVNQSADEINETVGVAGLTHVQLHGDETPAFAAAMTRPVIKSTSLSAGSARDFDAWPAETIWLVDADDRARRGGTGTTSDWPAAAALARMRHVWLAGGLTPENVREAIERVRPLGIDVSSGVERSPGVKDHDKLKALFEAVGVEPAAEGFPSAERDPSAGSGSSRHESRDESLRSSAKSFSRGGGSPRATEEK